MEHVKTTNRQRAPAAKKQPVTGSLTKPVKNTEKTTKVSTIKATVSPTVSPAISKEAPAVSPGANILSINGIKLNADAARNAIIMSEIIGPPKAKRRRGR